MKLIQATTVGSIVFVLVLFFMVIPAYAQEDDNYGILTVSVKDGVTGGPAQGVEIIIGNAGGVVERMSLPDPMNHSSTIHFWLRPGTYRVQITQNILGAQWVLYDKQVDVPKAEQHLYVTVSATVVPLEYVPWLCGAAIAISAALISFALIRKMLNNHKFKLPKNNPPPPPNKP